MELVLVFFALVAFVLFLLPHRLKKYWAALGWTAVVLSILVDIPYYLSVENNYLYPAMGLLGIPFLLITVPALLRETPVVFTLTRAAAIASLIYIPFAFIPELSDWLIGVVTVQVLFILTALGFSAHLSAWNTIMHGPFQVEIILACTGIQAIAMMCGIAWAVPPRTTRQKLLSFFIVAPLLYILNLFRDVFVVMAYTAQWFPFYPEIAGNGELGYESFFWAHNVMSETGALVVLVVMAYSLFLINPGLGAFAEKIVTFYTDAIRKVFSRDT